MTRRVLMKALLAVLGLLLPWMKKTRCKCGQEDEGFRIVHKPDKYMSFMKHY